MVGRQSFWPGALKHRVVSVAKLTTTSCTPDTCTSGRSAILSLFVYELSQLYRGGEEPE